MHELTAVDLEATRAALRRDGFARLGPVLAPETVEAVRAGIAAYPTWELPTNPYGVLVHNVFRRAPACVETVRRGDLARAVCALLEADEVLFFQDLLIAKQPATPTHLKWHQDYSYWPLEPCRGLTVWLALDDATLDNGCLHYVPGSHLRGERRPADFAGSGVETERPDLEPLDEEEADRLAVPLTARAGEALVHDPLVWHMSPLNRTDRPRRAWSTSWVAPPVRWAPAHAAHPYNWELQPQAGALVAGGPFLRFGRPAAPAMA